MLVGIAADPNGKTVPRTPPTGGGGGRLEANWAAGTPKMLYTIDIKTGAFQKIYTENDWTNHLQMSPTDPHLIMFCHEGPWHFNDARVDDPHGWHGPAINARADEHESRGTSFQRGWQDGLVRPADAAQHGVLGGGRGPGTGHRTWYHLERNEWSVHYNVSADGTLFAGDGGGPSSVAAHSPDGKTLNPPATDSGIYLFRPVMVQGSSFRDKKDLIDIGYFRPSVW